MGLGLGCATPPSSPNARSATPPVPSPSPSPSPTPWIDSTLASLSLREKVGQLFGVWVAGDYLAVGSESYERLHGQIAEQGIGSIVVSIGPPFEVAAKLNLLQSLARVPLLITADMEHGPGQRLNGAVIYPYGIQVGGGTEFPPVMALGAAGDPELAYAMGRVTAREARATGVHMIFAPVADVNNNPDNPIINTRSYGEDPERVAEMVVAHLRGMQEHGVLATAKHFPGHGDTDQDTHLVPQMLRHSRAHVDSVELVPFRAAIDAQVAGVMSAHIAFPAITGDTVPATLNAALLTGLLQDELGFSGLVITDALDMGAIVERYGQVEPALMALQGGADMLLMPPNLTGAIDAVVSAVERGELSEARIDRSVRKLLALKHGLGLDRGAQVDLARLPHVVGTPEHRQVAEQAAQRSIVLVRNEAGLVPFSPASAPRLLSIVYADDPDPITGRALRRALTARWPVAAAASNGAASQAGIETVFLSRATTAMQLDSVFGRAADADLVLFSPFVRVLSSKGHVAIAEPVAALVERIAGARPTVVAAFGNPYVLRQFPGIGVYLLGWGTEEVAQVAAARALLGEAEITGRLPISIPPYHAVGDGLRVTAVRAEAVREP
ncbi:MAG: glycoside hydrolase family 3 protein [Longimicrobiales bacterium]